ncbi:MAG: hypothetical protein BM559_03725 [Roseobacter sp. MedPE-SWchi]|nr:MAG: hypothetical protein BM559_03725 [Roseobacter sp. MedPE-SWchi]
MRLFLATLVFCLASVPLSAEPLTQAQIKQEILDRAFRYEGQENGQRLSGVIAYRADGKIFIQTAENYLDGGTWQIKSNALCTRILIARNSNEICFRITPAGIGYSTSHGFRLTPIDDNRFQGA